MSESQIGQDIFVVETLKEKRNGVFVDIGGAHPKRINNTYLLEKNYCWGGISLDIGPPWHPWWYDLQNLTVEKYIKLWNDERDTPLIICDALKQNYYELFKKYNMPEVIDFLSLDIEPPQSTLECLKILPHSRYKFRVICFEHDNYLETTTMEPSRRYLSELGYNLARKQINDQEDWWVLQ